MKYKAKDNFELKNIADDYVLISRGESSVDFSAVIVFNEAGVFLWNSLSDYLSCDELANKLCEKFGIDFDTAKNDTDAFIKKMSDEGLLDIQ